MYDYIIVGAGSAGCVLADRLSEDGTSRVLLLEAGPPDGRKEIHVPAAWGKLFKSEVDWDYTTEPQRSLGGRKLYWPRGKMLGGSSSMNAMMYVRGHRDDYDEWARLGNSGWSYEDVLPYFRRSEHHEGGESEYHGTGGPICVSALRAVNPLTQAFLTAAEAVGIPRNDDVNGRTQEGATLAPVTIRDGKRCSTAAGYLQPAKKRSNLTVATGALARRVVLDGRRAVGVEYVVHGTERQARARREVILCGGAVNTPQLLMLSGIGPDARLAEFAIRPVHHLPGVGENLQDHLVSPVLFRCTQPVSLTDAERLGNLLRYVFGRRGPLTSNVAEACAFVRSDPSLPAPDVELIFAPFPIRNHNLQPPPPQDHGFVLGTVLLRPRSSGRISLRSPAAEDAPRIDPLYLSDPDGEDVRTLEWGTRLALRVVEASPFDPYRGEEVQPGPEIRDTNDLQAFIRENCETLYHPVGTCRMGTDPMAVVDPQLRVHGIERLRVVDASVMPRIVRGHTNAPVIAIAERAADLIRGKQPIRVAVPALFGDAADRAGVG